MDAVKELETRPEFSRWHWLAGALQQHHYALALLMELLLNPQRKDAPRIQQGLDYAFEPPNLPPLERVRWTVTKIRDRMKIYMDAKKLRAPVSLMEKLRLGRAVSEGSERSSSAEVFASPDGTNSAHSLSHSSDQTSEALQSYPEYDTVQKPEPMPTHLQSLAAVQTNPSGEEQTIRARPSDVASNKDIMDLDWVRKLKPLQQ